MGMMKPNNKNENRGKSHQVRFQAVRIYFLVEISIVITFLGINTDNVLIV